ncbi:DUF4064 domain-containing protein [Thalassobacillus pellis]|uniref:DUF4064 domain-containing protein n=1 Tax=Thalassobacillus pellis TaxID=748008 RepID=UPI00195F848F|nr:DUF4064 domain-containing protein [Thalassobacillus pellis]MBM7553733.1 hypothetical protein [Thalassobacillus pellis]
MKRTAEIVLTVIGMVLFGLVIGLMGVVIGVSDNEGFRSNVKEMLQQDAEMNVQGINVDQMIDSISNGAMFFIIVSVVSLLLGLLCIFFLKGDKRPKAAGIILILTAILATVVTIGIALVAGAFYLIAGIVSLVRKKKVVHDDSWSSA